MDIWLLTLTAVTIGFIHTLLGPDHYIPFIAMSKARGWSLKKTAFITFFSGLGHVGGGVLIGIAGMALGMTVDRLIPIEASRGEIAAWLLLGFGLVYMIWGLKRAYDGKPHVHGHAHEDGTFHYHGHGHLEMAHAHVHEEGANITPWVLFTIFVLGPCEPLIPLLMYPAATHSLVGLFLVVAAFAATTIVAMLAVVVLACRGLSLVRVGGLDRYAHALAGGSLALCGGGMVFLGL